MSSRQSRTSTGSERMKASTVGSGSSRKRPPRGVPLPAVTSGLVELGVPHRQDLPGKPADLSGRAAQLLVEGAALQAPDLREKERVGALPGLQAHDAVLKDVDLPDAVLTGQDIELGDQLLRAQGLAVQGNRYSLLEGDGDGGRLVRCRGQRLPPDPCMIRNLLLQADGARG